MANQGKVIHISSGLHQRLKKFCASQNVNMKEFVEEAITLGMSAVAEAEKKSRLGQP